jgi:hypothetical protein
MTQENNAISNFFLQMYKHEMANCINNFISLNFCALEASMDDFDLREDLKYSQAETAQSSSILLEKLNTLIYPQLTKSAPLSNLTNISLQATNQLPLNPATFVVKPNPLGLIDIYPLKLMTQILSSIFRLLISNHKDSLEKRQIIELDIKVSGQIIIAISDGEKIEVLKSLINNEQRYSQKSKYSFEYEFLRLLQEIFDFKLCFEQSNLLIEFNLPTIRP